jgi:DNA-binding LacI/PurR family transcriptional regulator
MAALRSHCWLRPTFVSTSEPKTVQPRIRSSTDFARYVGLARTTVSRVLNGQPGLKKKTIERVQRAIEETGFVPNAYALHLKGKRTSTVGVCMQNLITPPLVHKLSVLQKKLRERDFTTFIEVFDPESSWDVIKHFLSLRVEAVVFIGYFDEQQMAQQLKGLGTAGTPSLVIDHFGIKGANTVSLDRVRGMSAIMEHLIGLGHRQFGLLAYSDKVRSTLDRVRGIREALAAHGLDFDRSTTSLDHLHVRDHDFEYGRALAKSFVERGNMPTALVALNDEIAIGAMHGLKELGVRVPYDVSVTGFNNQDICLMTAPSLTSVDQRIDATIEVAAELLLSQIGKPLRMRPLVRMIDPLLIVRASTGPARAN